MSLTKAISLPQPWASAVALGINRYVQPPRSVAYRGLLFIYASSVEKERGCELFKQCVQSDEIGPTFTDAGYYTFDSLPQNAFVGSVDVHRCGHAEHFTFAGRDRIFGEFSAKDFVWNVRAPRKLRYPMAFSARSAFFSVPVSIFQILTQL